MTKGNSNQTAGHQAQNWDYPLSGLGRIREAASRDPSARFTSLMHHITPSLLSNSFHRLKRDAASGVDEVTWYEYLQTLESRVEDLHDRVQSGRYRAQPSKRIYIPKPDGGQRPIGIAALEDKIVQAAVTRVLEQIYEEDFLGFSYGCRPRRGPHHGLDAIWVGVMRRKVNWILDADIRGFYDSLDHTWLMKFLEHRIGDRRLLRLISKWLRAGVSEEGQWSKTTVGTPQGAVISPLLANIFLHYVLDLWVQQWRHKQAQGDVIVVRYVDDFVLGFQHSREAKRFLEDLKSRLNKFHLELHEDKTRLVEFGRYAQRDREARGAGKPETFDFLGMTHICSTTRTHGRFTVRRQPIAKRLGRKLQHIGKRLHTIRHWKVSEQGQWLRQTVQGLFNYYAVPGTCEVLSTFRKQVSRLWLRALRRRSHKARSLTWKRMALLLDKWLPVVRVRHPYPNVRLRV